MKVYNPVNESIKKNWNESKKLVDLRNSPFCKPLNEERKRLGRSCISRSLARYDIKPQRQGNGRKYVNESQVMNEWGKEWPKKMREKNYEVIISRQHILFIRYKTYVRTKLIIFKQFSDFV